MVTDAAVAPDCLNTGLTEGAHCSRCDGATTAQTEVPALGHDMVTDAAVAPDCLNTGLTEGSHCSRCDGATTAQETVPALGHDWSACDGICVVCKTTCGHTMVGDTCATCGYKQYTVKITSSSIVLGNELAMYFYVPNGDLTGTDYVAVVTKTYADGRDDVTVEIPFSKWEDDTKNNRKRFKFDGIAAKEMGDAIHVVIKNTSGTILSQTYTDSIQGYVERGFQQGKATGELATMLVDMLNYGAAAQGMFTYNTEHPANENMAAYQKFATQNVSLTNKQVKGTGFKSMSLMLESNISVVMFFDKSVVDQTMTAVVTFVNHYGNEQVLEIPGSKFEDRGSKGWAVVINKLVVADGCQLITCKFLDAEGKEVEGVYGIDSMESMCARAVAGGGGTWYEDIMKFSISAYNYFH